MKSEKISANRLRQVLQYNTDTGDFVWLERLSNRAQVGQLAGSVAANGYVQIQINGRLYFAHRLAWLYVTGEYPKSQVDHRDRNRSNNAWINLREATPSENSCNKATNNRSGVRGVSWNKRAGKWVAQVSFRRITHYLGLFDSIEEAGYAVISMRGKLHGEFAKHQPA